MREGAWRCHAPTDRVERLFAIVAAELGFYDLLFKHYDIDAPHLITYRVRLLHQWHTALRLLWSLDHAYPAGIQRWSTTLMYQSN